MTWRGRVVGVLLATLLLLVLGTTASVARAWYDGDCWPWQDRRDTAGATFCDGDVHPHSR